MLIYNYEKNFLGIDDQDLKALGFQNLDQLRSEVSDFADLFVKTPGYIHNFKHVHWIDFIACAESSDDSKVIIHANNRSFRCTLDLKIAYLIDSPTSKAYLVNLQNLRELTNNENKEISSDIVDKPTLKTVTPTPEIFTSLPTENIVEEVIHPTAVTNDPYEIDFKDDEFDQDETLDIVDDYYQPEPATNNNVETKPQEEEKVSLREFEEEPVQNDFKLDLDDITKDVETDDVDEDSDYDNSYVYDPNVASSELGLPVDLIEEFIQDFIAQSKEFKNGLYEALELSDLDKLRVQSHKLKGVAANLRIENAFETLTIINSSDNLTEIKTKLDQFYKIIATLAKEDAPVKKIEPKQEPKVVVPEIEIDNNEDELKIEFKEEAGTEAFLKEEEIAEPDTDDLILDFKDDDEDEDDLYMDYEPEAPKENLNLPESLDSESDNDNMYELQIDEEELTAEEEKVELVYDRTNAAEEIGLDIDSFNELFEDYISGCKASSAEIAKAIQNDDSQLWKSSAIQLKGMSDNMRITHLKDTLEMIINTEDSSIASGALKELDTVIENVIKMEA